MEDLSLVIIVANTVTLLFGSFVTVLAFRAYRRTGSASLRLLSLGLGLVTFGTLVGGLLHQVTGASLLGSIAVYSVFTAFGFVTLSYSLYAEQSPARTLLDPH